ncbi:LysR family transcriptional regulator [Marivirga arenosa]|uniref:LysR family transcriptional regulator n=1 Tax=Marivirga arenosa TaxID=3059076 RepID=A0AA51X538_9BACT|nr:LysR family transcriptional regulator [Marivirga sp. BKB1-2]WNB16984.1 LysR family transcriptional regulator [Marivirga sp. BKB1-2]
MNYTLHQLQIFHKIVELGSITKASEALHLTQPAVSIQLKNLQSQFDKPLLEIIGRKVYITDFGNEIANNIESIVAELDQIEKKRFSSADKLSGKLKLSIVSTAEYIMPHFLTDFIKKYPEIQLSMEVTNKQSVIESLENNKVDFSMVSVLPDMAINHMELMKNELYLVGPANSELNKNKYDVDIFRELPLIYREEGSGTRYTMESFIKKNKIPARMNLKLATNEAVKQAVIAGLGYSILPLIGIKNELKNRDLKIIPVKNFPIHSTWHLIWLKEKRFSPVAQAYLDFIKKEIPHIIEAKFQS